MFRTGLDAKAAMDAPAFDIQNLGLQRNAFGIMAPLAVHVAAL